MLKHKIYQIINIWDHFWFQPLKEETIKLYQRVFGGVVLIFYCTRFWNLDFYNDNSLVPKSQALELFEPLQKPIFNFSFWPDSWAFIFHLVFLVLMLLLVLGYGRRPLIFIAWLIHLGFLQRNWAAGMGVDTMVTVFLFYFSFVSHKIVQGGDLLSRVMVRMSQVHLSVIYFYTGLEKLRGPAWWEGSALWTALSNPQMTSLDFTWLHQFPGVIASMSHGTVLFELMFLPLVWNPHTRKWILSVGIVFHFGIAGIMDLWGFSAVMVSQYLLWVCPLAAPSKK